MKLSIIVPVYNTGEYLRECIQSIQQQTMTEWELLLIDDGSKDHSGAICDEYAQADDRITVVHKINEGVSVARNTGLALAKGDYIGFVDSDDTIQSDMFERMYREALSHQAEIVMCDAVTIYPDGRKESDTITQLSDSGLLQREDWSPALLKEMAGSACRCMYASDLIRRYAIRFPVGLKFSEDRIFNMYAMGYADRLYYMKEALYHRLMWEGSCVHRFHADYFEMATKAAQGTKEALFEAWNDNSDYQAAYLEHFVMAAIGSVNNFYYKTSPLSFRQKYRASKEVCYDPQLQEALRQNPCGGIRGKWISRKWVTLVCLSAMGWNLKNKR